MTMLIGRVGLTFASDSTTTSLLKTTSSSPQPSLPIVHQLLPVRSRPMNCSMLSFIDISYKLPKPPLHFVLAPFPPRPSHLQISVHCRDSELRRQCDQRQTTSSHFLFHGSLPTYQRPLNDSECSISASFAQPFKNSMERPNGPYHFPPIIGIGIVLRNLWRQAWSTSEFSSSPLPQHTKPLTPRISVCPPLLNPLLQYTPSYTIFHFSTSPLSPALPPVGK